MGYPEDLDVAPDGSVYFTDSDNARIRRVAPDGTIDTVAGTGEFRDYGSPAGDGGPAIAASLNFPVAVVVNATRNVFIADFNNMRVRRVDGGGAAKCQTHDPSDPHDSGSRLRVERPSDQGPAPCGADLGAWAPNHS